MNEEQAIINQAIKDLKAIPGQRHVQKWRSFVLRELEVLETVARFKMPNPNHPLNQPIPEEQ